MTNNQKSLIRSLSNSDTICILFVCLGNICRSPAAEGVMKSIVAMHGEESRWHIDSAGTGGWHVGDLPDKRMRVHAARRGLVLDHICRRFRTADFDNFDLIIVMDDNNYHDVCAMARTPGDKEKIIRMADFVSMTTRCHSIPDPYYEGSEGFELVLDLLDNACGNMYSMLR